MVRRRRTSLLSVVLLISIALGACSSNTSSGGNADPTPTAIPTSIVPTNPTYEVQRGTVIREMEFGGQVAPVLEEDLFFKMGGYVSDVYVSRNDEVQEGDLLAELEVTDLKNQITQTEAELQAVQMDYDRRMVEANNSVRSAELQLARLQASNSTTAILSASINLEKARARLASAQDEYNKSLDREWERDEVRQGYANALQEAEWGVEMAEAQYQDALQAQQRNAYEVEQAQMDLELAEMRRTEIQVGLDITRTQLSLERLHDQLSDARIEAPFDGTILLMNVIEGRAVQGYDVVMRIADPSELDISADLQANEMSELAEGMEVVAEFVNRPGDEYIGTIRRLPYPYGGGGRSDSVQDEDQSVRIDLDLDEVDHEYDIGDRLRLTVELERAEDTLWLPPQAVRTFEGRSFVVLQEEGAQRRVDVRLGIQSSDRVEILDGLSEGQVVISQ